MKWQWEAIKRLKWSSFGKSTWSFQTIHPVIKLLIVSHLLSRPCSGLGCVSVLLGSDAETPPILSCHHVSLKVHDVWRNPSTIHRSSRVEKSLFSLSQIHDARGRKDGTIVSRNRGECGCFTLHCSAQHTKLYMKRWIPSPMASGIRPRVCVLRQASAGPAWVNTNLSIVSDAVFMRQPAVIKHQRIFPQ